LRVVLAVSINRDDVRKTAVTCPSACGYERRTFAPIPGEVDSLDFKPVECIRAAVRAPVVDHKHGQSNGKSSPSDLAQRRAVVESWDGN